MGWAITTPNTVGADGFVPRLLALIEATDDLKNIIPES